MNRKHSLNSIYGVLITSLPLAILGMVLWRSGGQAFSPGELSALTKKNVLLEGFESHYEFGKECSRCHKPVETTQDVLCMACHSGVKAQIEEMAGIHSHIEQVNDCAVCHSDHHGQTFDMTRKSNQLFDHSKTGFSLVWHQYDYNAAPMVCAGCHSSLDEFSSSLQSCEDCHAAYDPEFILQHKIDFGQGCTFCHDGIDWMTQFDHQTTAFPLEQKHAQVGCASCHDGSFISEAEKSNPQDRKTFFRAVPIECVGCHSEPPIHLNLFSTNCAACHTFSGWHPAILAGAQFEHFVDAGFSLALHRWDYDRQPMNCNDCHPGELSDFDSQACIPCHSKSGEQAIFMSAHIEEFGVLCQDCHDGVDRMSNFEHSNFYLLDGQHALSACETCHVNKVFSGTQRECVGCHAEPVIHAGFFGLECQYCHTSFAWSPAQLREHRFPLDHGDVGEVECQVCHLERYSQYTCYGCHEHKPDPVAVVHKKVGIFEPELSACAQCHPYGLEEQ